MKEILDFLKDLERNNNRDWFEQHRSRYQQTREQFLAFTEILIHEIRQIDSTIPMLTPKDCMFRIFRDTRFSKDKRPYKTNYGSFIARGGRKAGYAGYYFHIEPGASFIGGGVYMPPAPQLKAIRQEIFDHTEEFRDIRFSEEFTQSFPTEYDDKLKTAPRGFPKDWEHIDLIRNKSYAYGQSIPDKKLMSPDLLKESVDAFRILYKMNRFINDAIDQNIG